MPGDNTKYILLAGLAEYELTDILAAWAGSVEAIQVRAANGHRLGMAFSFAEDEKRALLQPDFAPVTQDRGRRPFESHCEQSRVATIVADAGVQYGSQRLGHGVRPMQSKCVACVALRCLPIAQLDCPWSLQMRPKGLPVQAPDKCDTWQGCLVRSGSERCEPQTYDCSMAVLPGW
jgi:hypothetical protein